MENHGNKTSWLSNMAIDWVETPTFLGPGFRGPGPRRTPSKQSWSKSRVLKIMLDDVFFTWQMLVGVLDHFYFPFHIWVVILPIDSYFSRWLKPPTRIDDKSDNGLDIQYWLIYTYMIFKGQSFNGRKQQEGDGLWEWLPLRILGNGPKGFMAEYVLDKSWYSDIYPKKIQKGLRII